MRALLALACLAAAAAAPLGLILVGPLLLGVPHVAADLACLRRLPAAPGRALFAAAAAPLALFAGLQALGLAGTATSWLAPAAGAAAVVAAAFAAGGRAPAVPAAALVLLAAAALAPRAISLALAHGHNLAAIALWLWWGAGRRDARVPLVCAAGLLLIFIGAFDSALPKDASLGGLSWTALEAALAPGLPRPWGGRVVLTFAFLQAVHYGAWLLWLPADLAGGSAAEFWRDARASTPWAWVFAAAALAVPLAGLAQPAQTRETYLALAGFHGWLELSAAAFLLARPAVA